MRAEEDDEIIVRVCDFGIAKQVGSESELTTTGSQLGTPDYVSPEQLKSSKHVDERADVWSLGATLYQMLCGAPPYAHIDSVFDLITAIVVEDVPHLGNIGELVRVKPGYGRNYLLPRKLAVPASVKNKARLEHEKKVAGFRQLRAKAEAKGSGDFSLLWSGQSRAENRGLGAGALTKALAEDALAELRKLASS